MIAVETSAFDTLLHISKGFEPFGSVDPIVAAAPAAPLHCIRLFVSTVSAM
jgi:hypothetical protein